MKQYRLSIVIPTYNRCDKVVSQLRRVIPEISDEVELVVLDNASDQDVKEFVEREFSDSIKSIKFYRNKTNIGLAGNICKCYEVATADWVWTLGDDDQLIPGAVSKILQHISNESEHNSAGFSFSTGIYNYQKNLTARTIQEFGELISNPKIFSNLLFLSSCVYHVPTIRKYIRFGYMWAFSSAPHIAMVLMAIYEGSFLRFVPTKIADWEQPEASALWNVNFVGAGLPTLAELPGPGVLIARYLENGILLHAPAMRWKEGLKMIFLDERKGPFYWNTYFNRITPFVRSNWKMRISAIFLRGLSNLAMSCPWLRNLGKSVISRMVVNHHDSVVGMGRL